MLRKPDPGEIYIRGRSRQYNTAEIGKAIDVERSPEGGGDNRERRSRRYKRNGDPEGGSKATIGRGEA